MVKKALISLTIVLLISLIVVNLHGEKDIIQIKTLNEVNLVEEIPYLDAIDSVQLDENDKVYDMRYYTEASYLSTDRRNFIYRVNIKKSGLVYEQVRGAEQMLFEKFGGFEKLLNKINPISPNNPRIDEYLKAAEELFK